MRRTGSGRRLALLCALAVATPAAGARAATLAAAGDIACPPGAVVDSTHCQQQATSDLVVAADPDAVALLGDTQYDSGSYAEFMGSFDPTWGRLKSRIFPAAGNHEYNTAAAGGYFRYFGAAAGSAPEGRYSFDLGSWHVVALSSNCDGSGCRPLNGAGTGATSTAQVDWLQDDLARHRGDCILAFWHHPLFSSGNGANSTGVRPLWDRLFAAGADVVLNGHSHAYERFAQQTPAGAASPRGIREFVVGTGGEDLLPLQQGWQPNEEHAENSRFGVLFLALDADSYSWQWRSIDGAVGDSGTERCNHPVAAIAAAGSVEAGAATRFDGAGSSDPRGSALTAYEWDFGDGDGATGAAPDHAYARAGSYTATLTVTDADGLIGRATRAVTVTPQTSIDSGPTGTIAADSAGFAFSAGASDATFECRLDGPAAATGAWAACDSPRSYSGLSDGRYTFSVSAIDAAGRSDPTPATRTFAVDTTGRGSRPPDTGAAGAPPGDTAGAGPLPPPWLGLPLAAPEIRRLRVAPPSFRPAPLGRPGRLRRRYGTRLAFDLSAAGVVRLVVVRVVRARCAPGRLPPCRRLVRAGVAVARFDRGGRVGMYFSGRIGRRALRPGRYRAIVVASAADGRRGIPRPFGFRILPAASLS